VLAQACFADEAAHKAQIERCAQASQRLATLLQHNGLAPSGGCDLFQYVRSERASHLYDFLARRGILVRLFEQPAAVRLGLPAGEADEQRLAQALAAYQKETA
jgi:cobalamin biosynthetic protein CobC